MAVRALVVAGGRGERMRASGVPVPKPLVTVGGITLLEWNVRALLHAGLRDLVVAVGAADGDLQSFVRDRMTPLVAARGARLEVFAEAEALGNIGCAGRIAGGDQHVLAVYADNLTSLPLADVLARHLEDGVALTLAVHEQPFRLPYGRVRVRDGRVVGYDEKPTITVPVCSAVTVLAPAALALLPPDRPTGLVDLTRRALAAGLPVLAYPHDAVWVDVNEAADVARAEALLREHAARFAPWRNASGP